MAGGTPYLSVSELQVLAFIVQVVGLQMEEKFIPWGRITLPAEAITVQPFPLLLTSHLASVIL